MPEYVDIEEKEDSAEKLAYAAGKPTKYFLFAPQWNLLKTKVNAFFKIRGFEKVTTGIRFGFRLQDVDPAKHVLGKNSIVAAVNDDVLPFHGGGMGASYAPGAQGENAIETGKNNSSMGKASFTAGEQNLAGDHESAVGIAGTKAHADEHRLANVGDGEISVEAGGEGEGDLTTVTRSDAFSVYKGGTLYSNPNGLEEIPSNPKLGMFRMMNSMMGGLYMQVLFPMYDLMDPNVPPTWRWKNLAFEDQIAGMQPNDYIVFYFENTVNGPMLTVVDQSLFYLQSNYPSLEIVGSGTVGQPQLIFNTSIDEPPFEFPKFIFTSSKQLISPGSTEKMEVYHAVNDNIIGMVEFVDDALEIFNTPVLCRIDFLSISR